MRVMHFSPVWQANRSERVQGRQTSRLACLMILTAALLVCVLPQAARAESGLSAGLGTNTELGASAEPEISLTPSTTKPYTLCPPGGRMIVECNIAIEPPAVATPSGYRAADGGPILGGGGLEGGWDAENIESAYKIPTTGGSGETVALVDAYGYADAEKDLNKYREEYKLDYKSGETACTKANGCFKKVNQEGKEEKYPAEGGGLETEWSLEQGLDVDMVSAACPSCKVLLVEANTQSSANTAASVEEAAKLGADEISNSYGYAENNEIAEACPSKKGCKEYLAAYKQSVPVTVSAGDSGYEDGVGALSWPASSPNVIAVGGTELTKVEKPKEGERGWTEVVWPGSGSGCSLYESAPTWQEPVSKACGKDRTDNDVAAVATHVTMYNTLYGGWINVRGTSVSSPLISGVEAHATSATKKLAADAFYKKPSMLFHISEGSNGTCTPPAEDEYLCHGTKEGYNGPTGMGTPDGVFTSTTTPPENTILPIISPATPEQGVAESATTGTWNNEPTSYTYQWERCNATGGECKEISGATTSTYTPVEADVEHTLVVKVTAKNEGGSNSALSAATTLVLRITEYALPSNSLPVGMTVGPDSNLWFTDYSTSKIGKITTSGTITEYSLPPVTNPLGIIAGPDGNLWFVGGKHTIGKITTSGTITEYSLPESSWPRGQVAAGPDGNVWFTDNHTSKIGKITTSGAITEYALPSGSEPEGVAAGPDGNLWFTDHGSSKIGKITTSGTITEYALPSGSRPTGITAGPEKENDLWFTDVESSKIGKITTSGTITEYALPSLSNPIGIAAGPDGNLWFTDYGTSKVGKITTSGTITEYPLPSGSSPEYVTAGPEKENNLWIADGGTSKIGKITP